MRKELLVYVDTAERGETVSVTAIANNRAFVTLNTPAGKTTVSIKDMIDALNEILAFDKLNNSSTTDQPVEAQISFDVEYINEE
jgi:hypothetical protein